MNMNKKVLFIIAVVMVFVSVVVVFATKDKNQELIVGINDYSRNYINNRQDRVNKEKEERNKLVEKLKGVVCWGSSNTAGEGSVSYIDFLYDGLKNLGYDLPVENKGVKDESSIDILGRQGSIPLVVSENAAIENSNTVINPIKIKSSNGVATNILCGDKNPGVNPCVINGVKGTIFGETSETDATKTASFYFQRENSGDKLTIPAGAVIRTEGSDKKYKDYITIMWLERKGWSTPKELIEQEKKFVNSINGKYIIIGLADGDDERNKEIDRLMERNFGDKYINPRKLLVEYSKQNIDKNTTEFNKEKISKGAIPSDLADNNGLLSVTGYKVLSNSICEKINSLGYLK